MNATSSKPERLSVQTVVGRVYVWAADILERNRPPAPTLVASVQARLEQCLIGNDWFSTVPSTDPKTVDFESLVPTINGLVDEIEDEISEVLDKASSTLSGVGSAAIVPLNDGEICEILQWAFDVRSLPVAEQRLTRTLTNLAIELWELERVVKVKGVSRRASLADSRARLKALRQRLSKLKKQLSPAGKALFSRVNATLKNGAPLRAWPWMNVLGSAQDRKGVEILAEDLLNLADLVEAVTDVGYFLKNGNRCDLDDEGRTRLVDASDALRVVRFWLNATQPSPEVKRCAVCFRHRITRTYCRVHQSSGTHPQEVRDDAPLYPDFEKNRESLLDRMIDDPVWIDPDSVMQRPANARRSRYAASSDRDRVALMWSLLRGQIQGLRSILGKELAERLHSLGEYFYSLASFELEHGDSVSKRVLNALQLSGLLTMWFRGIPMPPPSIGWAFEAVDRDNPLVRVEYFDPALLAMDLILYRAWVQAESGRPRSKRIDSVRAKALKAAGYSFRAIARELGSSPEGVIKAIRR